MPFSGVLNNARRQSKRVVCSYILDWLTVVVFLALAGGFHYIDGTGSRHAFSLQDPSISYPHTQDLVSNPVLYVASVVLPGILMALICLIFVPSISAARSIPRGAMWKRKLWEWHAAWLGLAISAMGAIAITNGLKVLAGKPRPHLLDVCNPDLSPESIARWRVGGLGTDLNSAVPIVVTWQICQNTNSSEMKNAFASWPSGHASTSWSGLFYFSLFLCAKFGVKIPFLRMPSTDTQSRGPHSRSQGAAPPAYLVLLAFVPIGAAFFISISRWFDYRHHGLDIFSGAVLGIFTAWISFHLYQEPISIGDGWAWGPRSRRYAFGIPVGRSSYVDGQEVWNELTSSDKSQRGVTDIECNAHTQTTSAQNESIEMQPEQQNGANGGQQGRHHD